MNARGVVFFLVIASAVPTVAQDSASMSVGPKGFAGSARFPRLLHMPSAISGAPYSAEQVHEAVQTLADGTRVTRKMPPVKMYRDSVGRTRIERSLFRPPVGVKQPQVPADLPEIIEIMDPVANVRIILDVKNQTAHRQHFEQPSPVFPASGQQQVTVRPGQERLGNQIIEGVLAEGSRVTQTVAAGEQGNDRPIVSTQESWFSPELRTGILHRSTDPRSGENTMRLTNISRNEPDPALFQIPPAYKVVDEKDEIVLRWGER